MKSIQIIPATLSDYHIIQNLARFYVYDRSGFMGWGCEADGMFECIDFKHYFENPEEKAFLIKVADELAGFVLIDKGYLGTASLNSKSSYWNIGEFFIIAKFQGTGVASFVAKEIFRMFSGNWSVAIMPKNIKALKFWRKIIEDVSNGDYTEIAKTADDLKTAENPEAYAMNVFSFEIMNH